MSLATRMAVEGDLPRLTPVLLEMEREWRGDPGFGEEDAVARTRAALFGDRPCARIAVAERGDRIVGFAILCETFPNIRFRRGLLMTALFITSSARRQGFGKALLDRVIDWARAEGFMRLDWTATEEDDGAVRFYQREGFSTLDRINYRIALAP